MGVSTAPFLTQKSPWEGRECRHRLYSRNKGARQLSNRPLIGFSVESSGGCRNGTLVSCACGPCQRLRTSTLQVRRSMRAKERRVLDEAEVVSEVMCSVPGACRASFQGVFGV